MSYANTAAITDRMIDRYYGEYERPRFGREFCGVCGNCGEPVPVGSDIHIVGGTRYCATCWQDHHTEILLEEFKVRSEAEQAELLGVEVI